jgi:hypothetical protein
MHNSSRYPKIKKDLKKILSYLASSDGLKNLSIDDNCHFGYITKLTKQILDDPAFF